MQNDTFSGYFVTVLGAIFMAMVFNACSIKSTGEVRDDTTLSGETRQLSKVGAKYTGPQYVVGILSFENKTPSEVIGIGAAATTILRTQLEDAGLKAILLDDGELEDQENLIALQHTGILKTGKKHADEGFDAIDYRVSGAITAYSEVEEGIDAIFYQRKTRIARVTVDYALVDIASGKALASGSGTGIYEKTVKGSMGLGARSGYDPGLRDGALRDALARVLNKIIAKLSNQPFRAKVVYTDGNLIVIRAGRRSRLSRGDKLVVKRLGIQIRDPNTGEVLGHKETRIGVVQLTRHQNENLSEVSVVSGKGFKVGDVVLPGQ